ncbi:MAG: flagellin [Butyrivibrio sp.]|nr:flagellin [Butyrivibrio sp.]
MSPVSSVQGSSGYSPYSVIAGGGQFNKAAQGASELAIQEKTKAQVGGLDAGRENMQYAKSALNVEDGAMEGITDFLQQIKEKSIKAMNGTLSDSDKKTVQDEINEMMKGIEEAAGQASFNGKNLLNGSTQDMKVASDGNGGEESVPTADLSLKSLGLEGFDVTKKDVDISAIDKALEKVQGARTKAGAQTNAIEAAMTYNSHAAMELNGYQVNKEEEQTVKAYQDMKTRQVLDNYQMTLQNQQMKDEQDKARNIFM